MKIVLGCKQLERANNKIEFYCTGEFDGKYFFSGRQSWPKPSRCWYHAITSDRPQTLTEAPCPLRPVSRFRASPARVQRLPDGLCRAWSSQPFRVPVATKRLCDGYKTGVLDEQMGLCTLHTCSLSLLILFTSLLLVRSSEVATGKSPPSSDPLQPTLKSTALLPRQKRKKTLTNYYLVNLA